MEVIGSPTKCNSIDKLAGESVDMVQSLSMLDVGQECEVGPVLTVPHNNCECTGEKTTEQCVVSADSTSHMPCHINSQNVSDSEREFPNSAINLDLAFSSLTDFPESIFDKMKAVGVLSLTGNDLVELPMSISQLHNLTDLDVSSNALQSLPSSVVHLSKLRVFNFASNSIEQLPFEFGRLTSLEEVIAYENRLESLPDTFGLLNRLRVLELNDNCLKSLPRNFGYLRALQSLNLSGNKLEILPDNFLNLRSILILDLSQNVLNCLPARFGSCLTIQRLFAGNNMLTMLPDWFKNMPNLEELNLNDNHLAESPLPDSFGQVCKKLKVLELGGNYIKHLPETIGELPLLERFHIGSIIGELERANFQNGNWIWKLPESFGRLLPLRWANLNENQLTQLPDNFGDLVNLEWLDLGQNRLSELPESFGNLRSLKFCQLSKNHLELLPSNFGNLVNLEELRLDNNSIAELPESFGQLTNLKTLDLFSNKLTEIPRCLETFTRLTRFDLGENKFGIHHLLVPQKIRPNNYKERDQKLKDNWRGRQRADCTTIEVTHVVEGDGSYDTSKEEPPEEPTFDSTLFELAARRNMSLWRSHGMREEERPVFFQQDSENLVAEESEQEASHKSNEDSEPELDDWYNEESNLDSDRPDLDTQPQHTVERTSFVVEEDWDNEVNEVVESSPFDLDDDFSRTSYHMRPATSVSSDYNPFFFLPASWHAQLTRRDNKTYQRAFVDMTPFQFDDVD